MELKNSERERTYLQKFEVFRVNDNRGRGVAFQDEKTRSPSKGRKREEEKSITCFSPRWDLKVRGYFFKRFGERHTRTNRRTLCVGDPVLPALGEKGTNTSKYLPGLSLTRKRGKNGEEKWAAYLPITVTRSESDRDNIRRPV